MKEQRANPKQTAGLEAVRNEIDSGKAGIISSSIARTEVFANGATDEQRETYQRFFTRINSKEVQVSSAIADKAAEIRRKTAERNAKGEVVKMMKTPDAIHLATAIIWGATEFQTWDGSGEKNRDFPLLRFSGTEVVEYLKITEPEATPEPQGVLFTEAPTATPPTAPSSST